MARPDMHGKVCLVTGSSSGIGRMTALGLAQLGATVVMVCRDQARGEAARTEIITRSGNEAVDLLLADLSSQRAIHRLSGELSHRHGRLHVLVNNAGAINGSRTVTDDGLEATFAVNHLAYFLLTHLLLDVLKAGAPARIVNVASEAYRRARIDFDDLQVESLASACGGGEKHYSAMRAYGQSKLANILFTYELARRLEGTGVTANCLHPGVVATRFGRSAAGWYRFGVRVIAPFVLKPEEGARTSLYLASSPEVEGVSGKYFVKCREARSSAISYDQSIARRLWQVSAELTQLDAASGQVL